jgi:HSP20 family molecular chaperone IbpA
MSHVHIQKFRAAETTPRPFIEELEALTEAIRRRAFNLFQSRYGASGSALEDWLRAERDLVWSPPSELVDDEKDFTARIAAPGFEAKDIQVSVMPDALIIQADATHAHEGKSGNVCFCEFSGKKLFRRLQLPELVDVDKVTASLDRGILEIIAPKAVSKGMTAAA